MFFHGNLIIGYIHEPEKNRYSFQLAGGEEHQVSQEEFLARWQEYSAFVAKYASMEEANIVPPISMTIRREVKRNAIDINKRRMRKLA